MLQILGLGFAYPKNHISNKLLVQLNPNFLLNHFESETGSMARYSALKPQYLLETKNSNLELAFDNLIEDDLKISERAVQRALTNAGISINDIGMVIGETSTPFQTIPSQAQRVAGHLGIKKKAFDILAGAASPSLHLSNLAAWKESALPEYILLVYSNLPTVFIDYSSVSANLARFSDSAAAVVVSTKRKGVFSVLSANSTTDSKGPTPEGIDVVGPLRISNGTEKIIESYLESTAVRLMAQVKRGPKKNYFLPSQIPPKAIKRLGQILGFAGEEVFISAIGDSFSSAPFYPLYDRWGRFSSGDRVFMVLSGFGWQSGHVVLEVN